MASAVIPMKDPLARPVMESEGQSFNPRTVLLLVFFGVAAFVAMLYFIGSGQTGDETGGANAHAESNGLLGYSTFSALLTSAGHSVEVSRSPSDYKTENLLILTPRHASERDELFALIENRRYIGPTLVIFPKWTGEQIPDKPGVEKEDGWINPGRASSPFWAEDLMPDAYEYEHHVDVLKSAGSDWAGLGRSGKLPVAASAHIHSDDVGTLVRDSKGQTLAGYVIDDGYYPTLDALSGMPSQAEADADTSRWNVTFVIEPDLMNNYGMADRSRALLAHDIVDAAMEGEDLGVTFDLTLNGKGSQENLLTLAFRPPFLAATICLLIALFVVGWRAFLRFGAPAREARAIAFGKTQLVANSAGIIQRANRLHLLAEPYIAMVASRLARQLALRQPDPEAIDKALSRRLGDGTDFSSRAHAMRQAHGPKDMLRAAQALRDVERMLIK